MSMYYCKKTRRQFLVGSGKALLALPLLPSLLPLEAYAQATSSPKRMMLFWFDHNNLNVLWPQKSVATSPIGSSGAREVLLRSIGTNASSISPILSNPLYNSLRNADQISVVRGLTTAIEYGPGHGNFTLASGMGRNSEGNYPTLDTIIEQSRSVYPTGTPASVHKAVRIDLMDGSLFYQKIGSSIQRIPGYNSQGLRNMYNQVFSSITGGTVPPQDTTNQLKTNILNRVYGSFTSFRNSRRISSDDRARLEQHMSYISDLQRSLEQAAPTPVASCSRPNDPNNPVDPAIYNGIYMDLLASAFKCGLTKFGVMAFEGHDPRWIPGLSNLGTVVHDAMHGSSGHAAQTTAYQAWWTYFANMIANRFLTPLNEEEGNTGRTYVQNMVTGMLCVGGMHDLGGDGGHSGIDSQQVLIGNMGGAMRSGRYTLMPNSNMPYNCFLLTLLNLMGVPASEYAYATGDGRGIGYYAGFSSSHPMRSRFYQPITELLA